MHSPERPTITPKTAEQINQQNNLVGLQQSLAYGSPVSIPPEAVENPLLFKQGLKEYRAYEKAFSKDNIPARPRPGDEPYRKYERYLQALREVRRDQSTYLQDSTSLDSASPREEYLEKAKFSPHLADKVLFQINTFLERGKLPKISEEQRQIAISSPQNFAEAINSALDKKNASLIQKTIDKISK